MKKCHNKSNIEIIQSYLNGERPFIQVGYSPIKPKRKIDEIWTDSHGIKWIQKKGYKTRFNEQTNLIRKLSVQKCKCGQDIKFGNRLDNSFFIKTGKCFDCIIKDETELRVLGIFPLYEKYKIISNYEGYIKDIRQKIKDSIQYLEEEPNSIKVLCNSEGFIENFRNVNTVELLKSAKEDLIKINKRIKEVSKERKLIEKSYKSELKKARLSLKIK